MKTVLNKVDDAINDINQAHKHVLRSLYAFVNIYDDIPHLHVGKFIKTNRKERGMTQEEMAQLIDCSRNHLASIEKMPVIDSVSFGIAVNIAYVLDVNIYELVN